jgi:hypothetical protein
MPYGIHTKRLSVSEARLPPPAALLSGALAGCGGSSKSPTSSAGTSASAATSKVQSGVAFSRCVRAHGVPNLPDPKVTGQAVRLGSPAIIKSPAFQSAMRSCQSLLPKGAPSSEPPSPQAQAQLLGVSTCMRKHGFGDFPDPTTSPPNRTDLSGIVGKGGYYLAIPKSIDTTSPAFESAAATCNLR